MLKKVKEYKIYRLVLDEKVVYIGRTKSSLKKRKIGHNSSNTFDGIKKSTIELIEITTDKTREVYWIKFYLDSGCELFNKYKGDKLSKEEIQKKSKEYYNNNKEKLKEYQKKWIEENVEYQTLGYILKKHLEQNLQNQNK